MPGIKTLSLNTEIKSWHIYTWCKLILVSYSTFLKNMHLNHHILVSCDHDTKVEGQSHKASDLESFGF